jgi:nitrate/nitrite transport system permease protein
MISVRRRTTPLEGSGQPEWKAHTGSLEPVLEPLRALLLSLAGLAGVGAIWALISAYVATDLPGPGATFDVFWAMLTDPFYDNGPNDQGIGLQLFASLQRVTIGFAIGTLIAVPVGVLIGINPVLRRVLDPVIQIMRPVSPLAWFPIGLVTFQSAPDATVFIICITSLWPTMINTAFGTGSVPQAHKNVARVFQFSKGQYFYRVVLPYSLPYILTGMRLSMGIAWMVIVAGEMLSGGTGIGFFIWDSWNALSLERVISAIIFIGLVGVLLDRVFALLLARVAYGEAV